MLLNQELSIKFPDSFHQMTEEELSKLAFMEKGAGICMSDPSAHIIITVGWKNIGKFAGFVLNTNDIAKNMKKEIETALASFSYRFEMNEEIKVGGVPARGISYQYQPKEGIVMAGESVVVKRKSILYYFHFYTRTELSESNQDTWLKILSSASWS